MFMMMMVVVVIMELSCQCLFAMCDDVTLMTAATNDIACCWQIEDDRN